MEKFVKTFVCYIAIFASLYMVWETVTKGSYHPFIGVFIALGLTGTIYILKWDEEEYEYDEYDEYDVDDANKRVFDWAKDDPELSRDED